MIISRTPYRISFFGGGTDYPAWSRRHGGRVLSTTIDKYCYVTARYLPPFFNVRHRIVWSHIETVQSIGEILHPAVREGLAMLGYTDATGVEIHHQGDLPARTGVGSSSSFAVGLILALKALRGEAIGRHDLALAAIDLEQNRLRDNVGSQDQVAAAYGGLNVIDFDRLRVRAPGMVADLPAGGQRLLQRADGYDATIVAGTVTYRHGEATAALPGRLVRGPQTVPA